MRINVDKRDQELRQVEEAQAELRKSIEESRRLAEKAERLVRQAVAPKNSD